MTTTTSSKKDKASARHTACVCPICGADAGYDLAVNPGPAVGGEPPDPFPPPEGVTLPEPTTLGAHGPWYLVLCSNPAHRTLVHESQLADLAPPESSRRRSRAGPRTRRRPRRTRRRRMPTRRRNSGELRVASGELMRVLPACHSPLVTRH